MYFPPAPFDLSAAIRASSLVGTAYDMYAQWQPQHKPKSEKFIWKPNSELGLQFSPPLWGEDKHRVVNVCDLVPGVPPCFIGHIILQHVGIPVNFCAQYGSPSGNHSAVASYGDALHHPEAPQGPLPSKTGSR